MPSRDNTMASGAFSTSARKSGGPTRATIGPFSTGRLAQIVRAVSHRVRSGKAPFGRSSRSKPVLPELHVRLVVHDDEGPLAEGELAVAVDLDHLELAHAVSHGAARIVVRAHVVRRRASRLRQSHDEALRTVARRHVRDEAPAAREGRMRIEGRLAG